MFELLVLPVGEPGVQSTGDVVPEFGRDDSGVYVLMFIEAMDFESE